MCINKSHTRIKMVFTLCLLLMILSCYGYYADIKHQSQNSNINFQNKSAPSGAEVETITYGGVTFSYNKLLDTTVKAETVEDQPLSRQSDKPDSVRPRHIVFHFEGNYGDRCKESFFKPEIHIYPIERYREQFKVSKENLELFDKKVAELKKGLEIKAFAVGEIPFVDFVDATQAFESYVQFDSFQNGEGVWFLTQFNIEPSLINNQGLTYIFQGVTKDGNHLILATFPVSLGFLPSTYGANKYGNYELPTFFVDADKKREAQIRNEYEQYVKAINTQIQNAHLNEFRPDLTYLQEIIRTLRLEE